MYVFSDLLVVRSILILSFDVDHSFPVWRSFELDQFRKQREEGEVREAAYLSPYSISVSLRNSSSFRRFLSPQVTVAAPGSPIGYSRTLEIDAERGELAISGVGDVRARVVAYT